MIVCLAIAGLTLVSLFGGSALQFGNEAHVIAGKTKITNEERELSKLIGEWAFYPGEFIDAKHPPDLKLAPARIHVPGKWTDSFSDRHFQAGTYRTIITVPEEGRYGIKAPAIRHAARVFINGEEAAVLGHPSTSGEMHRYREDSFLAFGGSSGKQVDLIIQVSNKTTNGGITKPILFGTYEAVLLRDGRDQLLDSLVISGYLVLGLLIFFHFLISGRARSELYFSLFCIMQAIYSSAIRERLVYLVWPEIDRFRLLGLQLSTLTFSILFFFVFIELVFNGRLSGRRKTIPVILLIAYGGHKLIPGASEAIIKHVPPVIYYSALIGILSLAFLYIIQAMTKALIGKLPGSEYLVIATVAFCCSGLILAAELLFAVDTGGTLPVLFFLTTAAFAAFIANRQRLALDEVTRLSSELLVQDQLKDQFLVKTATMLEEPAVKMMKETSRLISGEAGTLTREQQQKMIGIRGNLRRNLRLVESLKSAGGGMQPVQNPVALTAGAVDKMISGIVAQLEKETAAGIRFEHSVKSPLLLADSDLLLRILRHLISFAVRHGGKDETIFHLERGNDPANCLLKMAIRKSDLSEKDIALLFDPFSTVRTGEESMDMGLAIINKLVSSMAGEVRARTEGEGMLNIELVFPSVKGGQPPEAGVLELDLPEKGWTVNAEGKPSVLLVGSSAGRVQRMLKLLREADLNVYYSAVEEQAIEALEKERIDLVVLDVYLSDQTGLSVVRWVRERYDSIMMPVLLLTELDSHQLFAGTQLTMETIHPSAADADILSRLRMMIAMKTMVEESVRQELSVYEARISPHFLYNALNSMISLSYEKPDVVREALENLSIYFRAKLSFQKKRRMVPLEDEIELVRAYLSIEKLRFGERLGIHEDIDESINVLVTEMSVQSIVEQIVCSGLAENQWRTNLYWQIAREEERIIIRVWNGEKWFPGQNIGFVTEEDSAGRFLQLSGDFNLAPGSDYKVVTTEANGHLVTISIPIN